MASRLRWSVWIMAAVMVGSAGCEFTWNTRKKKGDYDQGFVEAHVAGLAESLSYRDTIAEQGWLEGLRKMRVRGYGVVAGLGTRGSRECPERIRDRLIQEMFKRTEFSGPGIRPARISPEQIIDDRDTAVVAIEGEIPAAALPGTRFDLTVRALPGTQTVSLEGGRLYSADLRVYRDVGMGAAVEGKVLATGAGAVFINPFADEDAPTRRTAREGIVIGGGEARESRRLRFVLSRPSYQMARNIARVINSRFPGRRKVAEASSPSYVELHVPPGYYHDPFHFLALVRHLYLSQRPGFGDERARKLAEEILLADAPHPDISLAWEGIGRTALPIVQALYDEPRPHARFYAAVAGLRLGDDVAVDVLSRFAGDAESPYRLTAIEEMGYARKSLRAGVALRQLLDDADPRIRVEAYEALLSREDLAIDVHNVGPDNFMLDRVPSAAGNLIYVRRTGSQRIVLLGGPMRCRTPMFYQDDNDMVTINAAVGADELTIVRRTPFADRISPPLAGPTDLADLILMLGDDPVGTSRTDVHGLALDYSTITHLLYRLCESGTLNAKFMLQTTSVTELFGPLNTPGRQETEL